tara:strand:+ start:14204 stop:14500 length:297 start_codon:yes stop_codon:yes gene_type:complete
MGYYNTTNESGDTLNEYNKKAYTQEQYIYKLIKELTEDEGYFSTTASVLSELDIFEKTPITSIRRAITNLVDEEKLVYTGEKRIGIYGRNESIIKLNK